MLEREIIIEGKQHLIDIDKDHKAPPRKEMEELVNSAEATVAKKLLFGKDDAQVNMLSPKSEIKGEEKHGLKPFDPERMGVGKMGNLPGAFGRQGVQGGESKGEEKHGLKPYDPEKMGKGMMGNLPGVIGKQSGQGEQGGNPLSK